MAYITNLGFTHEHQVVLENEELPEKVASSLLSLERPTITIFGVEYGQRIRGKEAKFIVQWIEDQILVDYLLSNKCSFKATGAFQNEMVGIFKTKTEAMAFGHRRAKELSEEKFQDYKARLKGNSTKDKQDDIKPIEKEEEIDENDTFSSSVIDISQIETGRPIMQTVEAVFYESKFGIVA